MENKTVFIPVETLRDFIEDAEENGEKINEQYGVKVEIHEDAQNVTLQPWGEVLGAENTHQGWPP